MLETAALLRIACDAAEAGNFDHARQCYETGAALGDAVCLHNLGYMYDVGEGVTADKAMAMGLYQKAWRRGGHVSGTNIAILYREMGKKRQMFRWYERVARAGDGSAQLEMAKCFLGGTGVRMDIMAALRCLAVANASDDLTECERNEVQLLLAELKPEIVNGS
jgi:hypothetical protein